MKQLLLLLLTALLALPTTLMAGADRPDVPPAASVSVGATAPDFALQTLDGKTYELSDLQGKVVLVNFWATWCPPCRAEMPSMETLYEKLRGPNFELLAVNVEGNAKEILPEFLDKHAHSFPILLDTEAQVQEAYGVYRFPETFIVGKQGVIVDHVIGARDWATPEMIDYLKKLMSE